jgi:purine-binding chemotaxis protein CheW
VQTRDSEFAGADGSTRALLRARAQRYATATAEEKRVLYNVVTFRRGSGQYALPLQGLREIRPLARLCQLPGTNPVVLGVVYYRGELISLHDLATFASGSISRNQPGWMLIAQQHDLHMALAADDVMDVVPIEAGNTHPVPISMGDAAELFAGMTDTGISIVDVQRMFETPRFIAAF